MYVEVDPKVVQLGWLLFWAEEEGGGDFLLKWGMLNWIIAMHNYKYKGYAAEVPVFALARRTKIGAPRLQRVLDEMVAQGLLVLVQKARQGHMPLYALPEKDIEEVSTVEQTEVSTVKRSQSSVTPSVGQTEAKPKACTAGKESAEEAARLREQDRVRWAAIVDQPRTPTLESRRWSFMSKCMVVEDFPVSTAQSWLKCPKCGCVRHPKFGNAPGGLDLCIVCWLNERWAAGQRTFVFLDHEYTWETEEEFNRAVNPETTGAPQYDSFIGGLLGIGHKIAGEPVGEAASVS